MAIPLPSKPVSTNERALSARFVDRLTNVSSSTMTLSQTAIEGYEQVFKNGLLLDPASQYSIAGTAITFATPLVTSDVVVAHYPYRP